MTVNFPSVTGSFMSPAALVTGSFTGSFVTGSFVTGSLSPAAVCHRQLSSFSPSMRCVQSEA
jgi:hypothetical protein